MVVRGNENSSSLINGALAYGSEKLAYSNHPIDGIAQFQDHLWPSGVPMSTFIVSIFVALIVGAASGFVYLVLADDGGRTGP